MSDAVLVLNAGSSSVKASMFQSDAPPSRQDLIWKGECEGIGQRPRLRVKSGSGAPLLDKSLPENSTHDNALAVFLQWSSTQFRDHRLIAVAHRVVHGGMMYAAPIRIDASVIAELQRLIPLAPLHQPHHLAAIAAITALEPALPQIACFDTAFHRTQSSLASMFALPRRLTGEGVRRYGFHGLSYEYIAGVLPDVLGPERADGRIVVAHLGSGASLCAMRRRESVATTMSFTALDGLMMGHRCGELDPGVVLYLMQEKRMNAAEISDLLYLESGLFGVSGISDDMRVLLASGESSAKEAVALFVYRINRELGSMVAALGGLDALIFTGGIGEHAWQIRQQVCAEAAWLGIQLDDRSNAVADPRISSAGSRVSVWVIPTDEDLMIARHAWTTLKSAGS